MGSGGSSTYRGETPPGSAHSAGAELNADPGPHRAGRLRDGVLPRALAGAAHHQQVPVPDGETEGLRPAGAVPGPEHQPTRLPERDDPDHCVLEAAAPDRVAVPGDAVPAVAVVAHARGREAFAELG